uniref:COG1305 Transglutaminase-like enzymes, putative cysteine proteases n=1 Tax=uncultured bacterium B3TF_MPn1 TaxID=1439866 RepID=W0NUQ1_9BACT|nr:COG1305 Transglutaminase-like enzymes, putative cysteine proteases [uncultured bacterium B3TF_MPn1]
MKYRISHTTKYEYEADVNVCQNLARLTPSSDARQTCLSSVLNVDPEPKSIRTYSDAYGNKVTYFEISYPHRELTITVESEVLVKNLSQHELFKSDMPWDEVRRQIHESSEESCIMVREWCLPSPLVPITDEITAYAAKSFTPSRPIIEATNDLMRRIYEDFKYDPSFTTISTPLQKVLAHKKGVCQDFAHLAIACLRSLSLPARYVSGYIETKPPTGGVRLEGADASHAWFSVYTPASGWVNFDPTNNLVPDDQHIVLAQGRDFADVTPLKGVIYDGGNHELSVAVTVRRVEH